MKERKKDFGFLFIFFYKGILYKMNPDQISRGKSNERKRNKKKRKENRRNRKEKKRLASLARAVLGKIIVTDGMVVDGGWWSKKKFSDFSQNFDTSLARAVLKPSQLQPRGSRRPRHLVKKSL